MDLFKTMEECVFCIFKGRSTTTLFDCQLVDLKMKELKKLMEVLHRHFSNEPQNLVNQAVLFEFRERTMLNPFSLIGSRMFNLLAETWENEEAFQERENLLERFKEKLFAFIKMFIDSKCGCMICNTKYSISFVGRFLSILILTI